MAQLRTFHLPNDGLEIIEKIEPRGAAARWLSPPERGQTAVGIGGESGWTTQVDVMLGAKQVLDLRYWVGGQDWFSRFTMVVSAASMPRPMARLRLAFSESRSRTDGVECVGVWVCGSVRRWDG